MAKGSVRKRGNKYQITVDIGKDELTGERKRHYESLPTEQEAQARLAEILKQVDDGTFIKETEESFSDFLDTWLKDSARLFKPNTVYVYERFLHMIRPHLPKVKAKDVRRQHAELVINRLSEKYKPSTVTACKRILTTAFSYGVKTDSVAMNPFKGISVKQEHTEYKIWTPEQVKVFLEHVRERPRSNRCYYVAFELAIRTGMRKSEILGLRWENVDLENRRIYVVESVHQAYGTGEKYVGSTKSRAGRRQIVIDDTLAAILTEHRQYLHEYWSEQGKDPFKLPNDYLILSQNFAPVYPRTLTKVMYMSMLATNVPRIRFHDLRHTHASLLLGAGVSPKVLQERLGHARIETTINTYSHLLPTMQEDAAKKVNELLS